jgi:hypothetical protein
LHRFNGRIRFTCQQFNFRVSRFGWARTQHLFVHFFLALPIKLAGDFTAARHVAAAPAVLLA